MEEGGAYNRGAQVERTVLAWNRSALALAANGALLVRQGFSRHLISLTVVGFAVMGVAVAVWLLSILRYPRARELRGSSLVAGRRELVAAAAVFVGLLSVGNLVLAAT
jgi:uncharacterized membrane protein YidH (DUF202 family)